MEGHANGKVLQARRGTCGERPGKAGCAYRDRQQLRDQLGVRVSLVPVHEINAQAQEYLANHPELFTLALERAKRMGWVDLREPMTTPDHPRSEQNS